MGAIDLFVLLTSVVEIYIEYLDRADIRYFLKPVPIFLMTYSLSKVQGRMAQLTNYGLMFSVVGDILLSIKGHTYFIAGTIFFFVAHVIYIVAFRQSNSTASKQSPGLMAYLICAVVCAAAGFSLYNVWPVMT